MEHNRLNISPGTLFAALFVALKLTGHIDWSWLAVFSPVLAEICLGLLIGIPMLGYILWKNK